MKIVNFILPICFLFCAIGTSAQTSKKTSQMLNVSKAISKLKIDVHSDKVEIFHTKSSRITIETTVKISAGSIRLLAYMDKLGRYKLSLSSNNSDGVITLSPNKNNKVIMVKGVKVKENINYRIYVPTNILFVQTLDSEQMKNLSAMMD